MPFVKKLKDVVHLEIKSQVIYLKMLDINAHYNTQWHHYVLNSDKLPHIINPIESKLGDGENEDLTFKASVILLNVMLLLVLIHRFSRYHESGPQLCGLCPTIPSVAFTDLRRQRKAVTPERLPNSSLGRHPALQYEPV